MVKIILTVGMVMMFFQVMVEMILLSVAKVTIFSLVELEMIPISSKKGMVVI